MKLVIEGIDPLLFRDAKPFDSSETSFAQTLVFPYPSTFYGALRSKILGTEVNDYSKFKTGEVGKVTEVIGTPEYRGSLRIKTFGLWSAKAGEPLVPVPRDLVTLKGRKEKEVFSLNLRSVPDWLEGNYNCEYILVNPCQERVEGIKKSYLTLTALKNYLNGEEAATTSFKIDKEYRTGIKINQSTATAEEGYLYRKEMLRFKEGDGFFVEVTGEENLLPESGLLKLGGENKAASYSSKEEILNGGIGLKQQTKEKIKRSNRFKLYLSTPAIFNEGWLPDWINRESLIGILPNGLKVKLLTAAVGKYQMNSGWDVANNRPKAGYRVVPAGSVYYFEVQNKGFKVEDLIAALHGEAVSDKKAEEGFGISYLGGVN